MSKKITTAEELSKVKYGDLLAKFEELGVKSAWKAGKKKKVMIEDAIERLKIKSELEANGKKSEEENVEKVIEDKKEEVAKEVAAEKEVAKAKVQEDKKNVQSSNLTQEQIKENIKRIDANLSHNSVEAQRPILLRKRQWLSELLEK